MTKVMPAQAPMKMAHQSLMTMVFMNVLHKQTSLNTLAIIKALVLMPKSPNPKRKKRARLQQNSFKLATRHTAKNVIKNRLVIVLSFVD